MYVCGALAKAGGRTGAEGPAVSFPEVETDAGEETAVADDAVEIDGATVLAAAVPLSQGLGGDAIYALGRRRERSASGVGVRG